MPDNNTKKKAKALTYTDGKPKGSKKDTAKKRRMVRKTGANISPKDNPLNSGRYTY